MALFRTASFACVLLIGSATVAPLRLNGAVTAAMTPFTPDGNVDVSAVPAQASYLARTGTIGILVAGTTGNSLSLSVEERKMLLEAWVAPAEKYNMTLLVHVGAEALADVISLTKHAVKMSAAALVVMPSVFFKPANVEAAALWVQQVSKAAPSTPLYYYHIPSMTGSVFKMIDLIKAVEKIDVPTFVGVKYTGLYEPTAFPDFQECQAYKDGKYDIYCGREEMTVQALSLGTRGFIGSQFNFAGDVYKLIRDVWPDFKRATELQGLAQDLLRTWVGGVPAGVDGNRLVAEYAGVPVGPSRLPNLPVSNDTRTSLYAALGLWCKRATLTLGEPAELCKHNAERAHTEHVV